MRDAFGDDAELNWAGKNNWVSTKLFVEALRRRRAPTRPALT